MKLSPDPVLKLTNVTGGYDATTVLRDVSLNVDESSIVALLGANGAGKTTLLKTVAGLLPLTHGHVILAGEDLGGVPAHRRQNLGLCYIPEGRGIFPSLTVRENLLLQASSKDSRDAVESAVAIFPVLGKRLSQIAGTLSGGEQQMLAMSQAYIQHPRLLLVDEASMGLAPKIVDAIFEFLLTVNRRGTAVLLVDQFVGRALGVANSAYVLQKGEIVFAGKSSDLQGDGLAAKYLGGAAAS
jgi:branched-chain amino acid transport system ATP-binding protein